MNRIRFCIVFLFICCALYAQDKRRLVEDKIFNFGATIGLKSSLPVINSIQIDGLDAQDIQTHYNVGYLASAFCRVNIGKMFIQPSISWQHSSCDIRFELPSVTDVTPAPQTASNDLLELTLESIDIPVLLGYKIIQEGPYGLTLMAGPKLKYNYKADYNYNFQNSSNRFSVDNNPWDVNIVAGIGVNIARLFFDFTYEFGLNQTTTDFRNLNSSESTIKDIAIDKRINVLSFSLGFLF